jgi:hypothetical protein
LHAGLSMYIFMNHDRRILWWPLLEPVAFRAFFFPPSSLLY